MGDINIKNLYRSISIDNYLKAKLIKDFLIKDPKHFFID
tara:strand:+ start:513 stop:629 length:117 start_codon:yes stop_codon:yes gene_type:complete